MRKKKLISKINSLEKKIKTNNEELRANKNLLKNQVTSPVFISLLAVGGFGLGYLIMRKKRYRNLFAYLTSASLAAGSIYKNARFVMNLINSLETQKTIPGNDSRDDE